MDMNEEMSICFNNKDSDQATIEDWCFFPTDEKDTWAENVDDNCSTY